MEQLAAADNTEDDSNLLLDISPPPPQVTDTPPQVTDTPTSTGLVIHTDDDVDGQVSKCLLIGLSLIHI